MILAKSQGQLVVRIEDICPNLQNFKTNVMITYQIVSCNTVTGTTDSAISLLGNNESLVFIVVFSTNEAAKNWPM